ncbi:MAG: translational GTPase TypA, partial [Gammaproteobacteria bacterium]|nr:translational GTPase TypA [Gammaproteobacteria bacterium]
MNFSINTSPFAGRDGKFVTSRNLKERLEEEAKHNVALRVEPGTGPDSFKISGRGELHLSILIENMRREGYELSVSRPEVLLHEEEGKIVEPWEDLVLDVALVHQGAVMEELGERKAIMQDMVSDGIDRVRLVYQIPTRGLIGFRSVFLTATSGTGIMTSAFSHFGTRVEGDIRKRQNGVLISMATGKSVAFALFNLQSRGRLFIGPNEDIYEGMVVGLHSRGNDLVVNPLKTKQLTNIRAAGSDENVILTSPSRFSLEQALEFIEDDELVEVTPSRIRIRKKILTENDRKRATRQR